MANAKVTVGPDGTITAETGGQAAKATWDGETVATRVLKSDPARRYTFHVVYPADKADVARALDGHRDFASKAAVQDAAWNWMRNFRKVGAFHTPEQAAAAGAALKAEGAAEPVESYIYQGPDWVIKAVDGSEYTVRAGDWCAGFIWSPEDWELVKSGKIAAVSVEGKARRRKPSPDAVANLRD